MKSPHTRSLDPVADGEDGLDAGPPGADQHFRTLLEHAPDLVVELDQEGRFLYLSPSAREILGVAPEDVVGESVFDGSVLAHAIRESDGDLIAEFARGIRAGAMTGMAPIQFRHADGSWRWLDCHGRTYRTEAHEVRVVLIGRDVTGRKRSRLELAAREERYRAVSLASREIVTELDAEGRVIFVSPTVEEVIGLAPGGLVGDSPEFLIHEDDVERLMSGLDRASSTSETLHFDPYRVRHTDGTWRWFEGSIIPYTTSTGERHIIGVSRDVSQRVEAEDRRRELERTLQQSQRLEGLGIMAGGIAHDFNNLLTPILGEASLALEDLRKDSPVRERLLAIQMAAHRAATLTNQMLAYAGTGPLVTKPLDLSLLVEEMGQLLESGVRGHGRIDYRLAQDLPAVDADPGQMSQVVMNLVTNAREALEDGGAGRILVSTGLTGDDYVPRGRSVIGKAVRGRRYVYFEVTDAGQGMDAETSARIFDPFFTTKFTGRGLGLAAVLGIVRGHDGLIELESSPGQGTRFRVLLPASREAPDAEDVAATDGPVWRGAGTVLVIDDDQGVSSVTQSALERSGLRVLTASDGRDGIEVFRRHADEIDLVVLDRTMPTLSGKQVFEEISNVKPDVLVILVSGYTEMRAADGFSRNALAGFLQKPFLPSELIDLVRRLISEE